MAEFEVRTVTATVELRDDGTPVLTGYASTFNEPYQVGFFREQIHPDAFKRTLSGQPDVRLLVDHEGQPLARTKSGTLRLSSDNTGLAVEADRNPKDPDWQKLEAKMERGDIDQMSFAFRVPAGGDEWDYSGDMPMRTIREANLSGGDVSVVTYPANENTTAQIRSEDLREAHCTLLAAMVDELRAGRSVDDRQFAAVLEAVGMKPPAKRTVGDSMNDTQSALSDAIQAKFGGDDGDEPFDLWVRDAGDDWVVFQSYGDAGPGAGTWRMGYTVADGTVSLVGDAVQVTAETTYTPVQQNSADAGRPSNLALRLSQAEAARRSAA